MSDVAKYRKIPVEIEAIRLQEYTAQEAADWCNGSTVVDTNPDGSEPMTFIQIQTLEGIMQANPGDYIVRGVQGEFYPVKPAIFGATYEPVEEETDE